MKISLVLQPSRPLTRSEAWGCFVSNLALPGSGSLVAGKRIGYYQIVFAFVALGVSVLATLQTMAMYLKYGAQFDQSNGDPLETLALLWRLIRWPLFGLGLFVMSIGWAVITSFQILAASPKKTNA